VSISLRKLLVVPKVMGRSIFLSVTSSIPRTTLWNGVADGRESDRGIPMPSRVDM
jgi:hypothetical protein